MIESLSLTNFQTHRKEVFDFDEHATTIIGPTDVGKSSLLRALRWLCLNQFDGPADGFIRFGADFAQVRLDIDERSVTRRKGDKNSYTLDGKRFVAFGAGKVPEEIERTLLVSEVNFQQQLEAHFWFSQTPGEVARQLNAIVNLSVIDEALSSVAAQLTQARAGVKLTRDRLLSARARKRELAWVPAVETALRRLERQRSRLDELGPRRTVLGGLVSDVSEHVKTSRDAGETISRTRHLLKSCQTADKKLVRVKKLRKMVTSVERAELVASTSIPTLPSTARLERLSERKDRLSSLLYKLNEARNALCRSSNVCPTCGQALP